MKRIKKSGFTLIELLVVIAIIGILAVALTPTFARAREQARRMSCLQNMKQIHIALTLYEQQFGMYPTRAQGTANQYTSGDAQEALNLLYRQYVSDNRVFSCASKPLTPTLLQNILPSTASGWPGGGGASFAESSGGGGGSSYSTSFGYSPGHNAENSQVVILADHKGTVKNSDNHGRNAGQNILSAGGSVVFAVDVINELGKDDTGATIKDTDIFADSTITGGTYPEWESYCR